MSNDFDNWNTKKKQLAVRTNTPTFKEREVWWCSLGHNIGTEQNGKGRHFSRPVIVLRKFSDSQFIGIPSTRTTNTSRFYHAVQTQNDSFNLILSQIRVFDSKRLIDKIVTVSDQDFNQVKKAVKRLHNL